MNRSLILIALLCLPSCVLDGSVPEMDDQMEVVSSDEQASYAGDALTHCVVRSHAVRDGEPLRPERLPAAVPTCFPTFSAAIEFATRGRVRLPDTMTVEELDDDLLNGPDLGTLATYVIAIEYEHINYGGASYTITNGNTCHGYQHSISSMPSGWNDVISSARAYAGCNHSYHYEHINFVGAIVDCHGTCSWIGDAMNDRTSSIRWTN